jgi:folate-binding protein YgfZ
MISGRNSLSAYRPNALLRATGEDAFGFLQGQFTNELRQPAGSATYGLWLNQKGKVLADSQVLKISEKEFLVISVLSTAAVIRQRLEDYIVADDVALADETGGVSGLLLEGGGSSEALKQLLGEIPAAARFVRSDELVAFRGQRVPGENFEVIGPGQAIDAVRRKLLEQGWAETDSAEVEFARISAGIPAVPSDLGLGDLPNEGGLEETALSYTKGCYLGQEVMARLKNLGQVRRRLLVVRGTGNPPAPLAALYQAEKKVGEIRSVAGRGDDFVAFAMCSLINLNPAAGLSLAPDAPPVITLASHG